MPLHARAGHSGFENWKTHTVLFLASQNISLFGSAVVGYAIVWHITLQTASGLWMMLATLACNLPQVLISLWGGVWADRYDRKLLIMLADGFVALTTLFLALALAFGFESLWLLLVALGLRSLGGGVQAPASGAFYTQLAPPENLAKVQGVNQTANAVLLLLPPAVGGVMLGSLGLVWALLLDVATALLAITVLGCIKLRGRGDSEAGNVAATSAWADMKAGLAYTFRHPQLRPLVTCYACFFFLVTPAAVLSPLLIARSFGGEVWRLTANEIAWAGASILGGVFVSLYGDFKDKPRALAVCLAAFGLNFALMGLAWNFPLYLIFVAAAGFFMPIFTTVETVFIQQTAAPEVLGRAFSIVQIISAGAMPVAILLFGPLADMVSVESLLLVTGGLMALTARQYLLASRGASAVAAVNAAENEQSAHSS